MTRQLCRGLPADWWEPASDGARLAMAICRRCPSLDGCEAGDPKPHGVIRAGIAYSDAGRVLPPCSACGGPNSTYSGGDPSVKVCGGCVVPQVPIPNVLRTRQAWMVALAKRGFTARQVAEETGASRSTVERVLLAARRVGDARAVSV